MTHKQYKLAKFIIKKHTLSEIQDKFGLDYSDLQYEIKLSFSDDNLDENTKLYLSNETIEEYEKIKSDKINIWFTRILSIIAIVISVISLIVSIFK